MAKLGNIKANSRTSNEVKNRANIRVADNKIAGKATDKVDSRV